MQHVIICRTDGTVADVMLPEKRDFHWYAAQIGAEIIQTVYARGLKEPYFFLCDEEGLLKEKPTINFLGSWLYETQDHGEPIVGDIMIVKEEMSDEGPDIGGMNETEAEVVAEWLTEHLQEAFIKVMARMKGQLKPI